LIAAIILLAAMALPAGTGYAQTEPPPAPELVSYSVPPTDQNIALAYWTPEMMRSAVPMEVVVSGSPTGGTPAAAPTGEPGAVAGSSPGGPLSGNVTGTGGEAITAFAYPFPYTRFEVWPAGMYKKYPYRVNGKLFFTQNGTNYVCSGTSVTVPDGLGVWTAGHCLVDGAGHWDTNFVFVPAYKKGKCPGNGCPYGQWTANELWSTSGFAFGGDLTLDLGFAHIVPNAGQSLAAVVGTAGFAWNQSRDQEWVEFGYPAASPFNGLLMIECNSAHAVDDTGIVGSGPDPVGVGCDMTGGSSGGSWNMAWSMRYGGYINGHNDYKYVSPSQPEAMYSPYFDTTANSVRCVYYTSRGIPC
jgi:hypothetical protein